MQKDGRIFVIWSRLGFAFRPRQFCEALNIQPAVLFHERWLGVKLPTPVRYVTQSLHTLAILVRRRPRVVWVQTPPFPLTLCAWLYCAISGARLVTDNHSSTLHDPQWVPFHPIDRFLARRAFMNIVHNYKNLELMESWRAHQPVIVLSPAMRRDELLPEPRPLGEPLERRLTMGRLKVLMVCQFGCDDCHEEVIRAALAMPDVQFFVTGDPSRSGYDTARAPENVAFPGLLPRPIFLTLMDRCDVVLTLTKRPDSLFWAIRECLALEKPFVATGTEVNRHYFGEYGVFTDNTPEDLVLKIDEAYRRRHEFIPRMKPYIEADKKRWAEDMERIEAAIAATTRA